MSAAAVDLDREEHLIGAVLISPGQLSSVRDAVPTLAPADFYRDRHRLIWAAIERLHQQGIPLDALTVADAISDRGDLDRDAARSVLSQLTAKVPSPGSAAHYAAVVKQRSLERAKRQIGVELTDGLPADEAIDRLAGLREAATGPRPRERTSWAAVDLASIIGGESIEEPPELLARSDGACLLYAGKSHAISAEPEAGKSWLALLAARGELQQQTRGVLYIDFEDGPESVVARLDGLGTPMEALESRFFYVRPDEPISEAAWADLEPLLPVVSLAVIDGVTEALTRHGLDLRDNTDVAKWLDLLPRRLQREGCTVLSLDHVTKDKEARGRYAIGAQHKLAGVDVAYSMKVVKPFGRGVDGLVKIRVEKDRPGYTRACADGGLVAQMKFSSDQDGAVSIDLEPPEAGDADSFRPTHQMERISRAVEETPGIRKNGLRAAVQGKNDVKDLALALLIEEKYIRVELAGQAHEHYSMRPFREDEKAAS